MNQFTNLINPTSGVSDSNSLATEIVIKEGKAEILLKSSKDNVFYNPVQEFNRDLSIAVLSVFAKEQPKTRKGKKRSKEGCKVKDPLSECVSQDGISIFEALAATGLRSVRYALEVPGVKEIIANDWSRIAVESIEDNVKHNNVNAVVQTSNSDASLSMYLSKSNGRLFDAVDLDPYGCPSRFLDPMVQVLAEGGLALVTATDMAVLAGNTPETCYSKYGSICLRTPACHEMALRILLQCIESHANRHGKYIVPLLSVSVDFYIRVFVRIFTSPATCKQSTSKLSQVFQCIHCKFLTLHPMGVTVHRENKPPCYSIPRLPSMSECSNCGHQLQMGGPVWNAPLHENGFVSQLLEYVETCPDNFKTARRMLGMLTVIKNEIAAPFYHSIDDLCSRVHCEAIPLMTFRSALLNAGYKVSETHALRNSVKSDAPAQVVWDIVRIWVRTVAPVAPFRLTQSEGVRRLLESTVKTEINFDNHPEAKIFTNGLVRFQINPAPHWGPGVRATNNLLNGNAKESKRKRKQNKRKSKEIAGKVPVDIIDQMNDPNN